MSFDMAAHNQAALDRMVMQTKHAIWESNIMALWTVAHRWPRLHGSITDRTELRITFPDRPMDRLGCIWYEGPRYDGRRTPVECIWIYPGQDGASFEPWDAMVSLIHELGHAAVPFRVGHGRRWRQAVRHLVGWLGLPVTPELVSARTILDIDFALYEICENHITPINRE